MGCLFILFLLVLQNISKPDIEISPATQNGTTPAENGNLP